MFLISYILKRKSWRGTRESSLTMILNKLVMRRSLVMITRTTTGVVSNRKDRSMLIGVIMVGIRSGSKLKERDNIIVKDVARRHTLGGSAMENL